MVWSDEFNYTGLPDNTKWAYDVGGSGWGNNELQFYTDLNSENARVENGNLIIEARKKSFGTRNYTSARLVSRNKGDWKYGRIEVKAKLPGGRGGWPAIWMLPTDWVYGGWPASGEIDIMEYVGYDPGIVHGTVHTSAYNHSIGTQKGASLSVPNAETAFHVYAIEWFENKIDFFIDNQKYFTFNNDGTWQKWPFDQRFHLILNIAVGGNWGGAQGVDDNIFPIRMAVDYVRVFQKFVALKMNGDQYVEREAKSINYTTSNIVGASYEWTVPADATVVSGQNTNSISVNWGNSDGEVKVKVTYNGNTDEISYPVKLVTIPTGDKFIFNEFDDGKTNDIFANQQVNTFTFSEANNELKAIYNVVDASLNPNFTISLDRPVKLSDLQVMQVRFKTYNKSNSVIARIDLVDEKGIQTNSSTVFILSPIHADGQYHLYEFDFSNRWVSNFPNFGAAVNKSRIMKAMVYLNYGLFGKNNKTDSIWIDYIHMIPEKTLSAKQELKNTNSGLFPNPTRDFTTIQSDANFSKIEIYTLSGKRITQYGGFNEKRRQINTADLNAGTYLLTLKNKNGELVGQHRLVKTD